MAQHEIDPNKVVWYPKPSTRQSTSLHYKHIPVNVTLTTPGTAQDLYVCTPNRPTVNIVENPSFELGTSGWTASGSAIAQSVLQALYGSNSCLVNPTNAAANEGMYYSLGVHGGGAAGNEKYITASAYIRGVNATADEVRIRLYGVTSGTWWNGNAIAMAQNWNSRSIVAARLIYQTSEEIRLFVTTVLQHNENFYVDGVQAELYSFATPYCDGSVSRFCKWDGTAHASTSRRYPNPTSIRGYRLYSTRDVYIDWDCTATTDSELVIAGTDFYSNHPEQIQRISFLNRRSGEQPNVFGELVGVLSSGDDYQEG